MNIDIDLGKVGLTWAGDWSSSTSYEKLTAVRRSGATYVSLVNNSGVDPVGNPSTWKMIAKDGEDGADGGGSGGGGGEGGGEGTALAGFKSIVFTRSNTTPSTPGTGTVKGRYDYGGTFNDPVPYNWSDGAPYDSEMKLWMTTRWFYDDEDLMIASTWATPSQVSDISVIDYEFSSYASPGTPITDPDKWHDATAATSADAWMAIRTKRNGVWSDWSVVKIKGEKGADGASATALDIKGSLADSGDLDNVPTTGLNTGDTYLIEGHMWTWDGDSWVDLGPARGSYVHVAFSEDNGETLTANDGLVPGAYVGFATTASAIRPTDPNAYIWTRARGEDGFGIEFIYNKTATNTAPDIPASQNYSEYRPTGWYDDPMEPTAEYPYIWYCFRYFNNGVWSAYHGNSTTNKALLWARMPEDANSSFTSYVFKNTSSPRTAPATPSGGSYSSPVPDGWSDAFGPLDNDDSTPGAETNNCLWMSKRVFSSDGEYPQESEWSTPVLISGEAWYSSQETEPPQPDDTNSGTSAGKIWHRFGDETTIWMAINPRLVKSGSTPSGDIYTPFYTIVKIKGEKGEDGRGILLEGTVATVQDLPAAGTSGLHEGSAYMVGSHMYVWDGDSWIDAGELKGPAGANGQSPYIHIKYSNDGGTTFTDNSGETPGDYVGIYWDYTQADSNTPSDYAPWARFRGNDGFGYEYIFKLTATNVAPVVPPQNSVPSDPNYDANFQNDDYIPTGWDDDLPTVTSSLPYAWVCQRKRIGGIWQPFTGSSSNTGYAAPWTNFAKDGQNGTDANNVFKSIVFKRSATQPETPSGGRYSSPIPSGWSDGVPAGTAILWMSTRIFSQNGYTPQQSSWTTPVAVTNTSDIEFLFSAQSAPGNPTDNPTNWHATATASDIWMAIRKTENGVAGSWQVMKIRYEDGEIISDVDFLKDVFGEDNVSSENGALLKNFIGVKNDNDVVGAMLNASDIGLSATHGKLMIAAGMQGISTQQQINAATFKLYEDGHLEASDINLTGTINASGGAIGAFSINGQTGVLSSQYVNSQDEYTGTLNLAGGYLRYVCSGNSYGGIVRIGYSSSSDTRVVFISDDHSGDGALWVEGNSSLDSVDVRDNIDLRSAGYIRHLRTNVNHDTVQGTRDIADLIHTRILDTQADSSTYNLPTAPSAGDECEIFAFASGTLNGNGHQLRLCHSGTASSTLSTIAIQANYHYRVVFDGTYWNITKN